MKNRFVLAGILLITGMIGEVSSAEGLQGEGSLFGRGWEADGKGGYHGTGDHFGKGWKTKGRNNR